MPNASLPGGDPLIQSVGGSYALPADIESVARGRGTWATRSPVPGAEATLDSMLAAVA
jgi:hypothetical protein